MLRDSDLIRGKTNAIREFRDSAHCMKSVKSDRKASLILHLETDIPIFSTTAAYRVAASVLL